MTNTARPITTFAMIFCAGIIAVFLPVFCSAQKKTIVLIRHAEKDAAAAANNPNPELGADGKLRAALLVKKINKYHPEALYSTNFKRTHDTLVPLSEKRHKPIQNYDPTKQKEFADEILQSKLKKFAIVGHSNTIPALANLIAKKEIFKSLPETEYSVIWIIRLKDGKFKKIEIIDY